MASLLCRDPSRSVVDSRVFMPKRTTASARLLDPETFHHHHSLNAMVIADLPQDELICRLLKTQQELVDLTGDLCSRLQSLADQPSKQINITIKQSAPKNCRLTSRKDLRNHCRALRYDLAQHFKGNTLSASELFYFFEQKVELLPKDLEPRSQTRTQPRWQDNLLQAISIQLLDPDFPIKRVPGKRNVFKIEI